MQSSQSPPAKCCNTLLGGEFVKLLYCFIVCVITEHTGDENIAAVKLKTAYYS